MKIIHCVIDDKFIDATIKMFDSICNVQNEYYLVSRNKVDFRYIKSSKVKIISFLDFEEKCIKSNLSKVVILHSFSCLSNEMIYLINSQIKVVWFSWGYDIYSNQWPEYKLIDIPNRVKGKKIQNDSLFFYIIEKIKLVTRRLLCNAAYERKIFENAINRVDYYSGVFPIEYDLLCRHSFFRAKRIEFNYVCDGDLYKEQNINKGIECGGRNIQIGNSASVYSNHLDTFEMLRDLNLSDRKVIVPLSYGNKKSYIKKVCKKGRLIFKDSFWEIVNFLSLNEYQNMLSSVAVAFYNIEQQAAVGNILMNIWYGAKIYMPKTSMGYRFFNDIGIKIYSLEEELTQEELDNSLSEEEIIKNRRIIISRFSYLAIKQRLERSLLNIMLDYEK